MFLIDRANNRVKPLDQQAFSELGFRERDHLQEWIAHNPNVFGEDLLIVQKEFAGFSDTSERLDLLALDKAGNLVIIENKLDDSGRDVTWQSLKYASYCSSLTKDQIRAIFQQYLERQGSSSTAEVELSDFFGQEYEEISLNPGLTQRIILVAANFRKEVTSTVLWLLNYNLRIQCFKITSYALDDQLLLNLEQIIPMRDAEDYIISMAAKTQDEVESQTAKKRRHRVRHEFWTQLLKEMNRRSDLYQNVSPGNYPWISAGSGVGSIGYNFVATRSYGRAELYLNRSADENAAIFGDLHDQREEIEQAFGGTLEWDPMDGQQACRIKAETSGDIYDETQWEGMIAFMVDAMPRLEAATRERLHDAARSARSR